MITGTHAFKILINCTDSHLSIFIGQTKTHGYGFGGDFLVLVFVGIESILHLTGGKQKFLKKNNKIYHFDFKNRQQVGKYRGACKKGCLRCLQEQGCSRQTGACRKGELQYIIIPSRIILTQNAIGSIGELEGLFWWQVLGKLKAVMSWGKLQEGERNTLLRLFRGLWDKLMELMRLALRLFTCCGLFGYIMWLCNILFESHGTFWAPLEFIWTLVLFQQLNMWNFYGRCYKFLGFSQMLVHYYISHPDGFHTSVNLHVEFMGAIIFNDLLHPKHFVFSMLKIAIISKPSILNFAGKPTAGAFLVPKQLFPLTSSYLLFYQQHHLQMNCYIFFSFGLSSDGWLLINFLDVDVFWLDLFLGGMILEKQTSNMGLVVSWDEIDKEEGIGLNC
ncbi:hypothetical protein VP01_1457g1 [Puccinia sorghi]|uniref:Uncharacterized protein n=1 Tax=Puccinia sorghi TaxID=27349 RepID=A0A0L6VKI5_9BASI|nr:hypothetical protein VP01_1457g1 [Puccinia sorghi]